MHFLQLKTEINLEIMKRLTEKTDFLTKDITFYFIEVM